LTTLAAFLPLTAVGGLAGRLFHPFAWTFSLLLLASLACSLTLVPAAAARTRRPMPPPGRLLALLERGHRALLAALLAHPRLALAATLLAFAGSLALLAFSPVRLLPLLDESSLMLSYQLAPGTSLAESERVGERLDRLARATPGVAAVVRRTGSPEGSQYLEGANEGEAILRLAPGADARRVRAALERRLARLPGVITRVNEPTSEKIDESFAGLPALFGVTVFAPDLPTLYRAARRIEAAMKGVAGIARVVNNTKVGVEEVRVVPDRAACGRYGVSPAQVAAAVHLALEGERVATAVVGQRPVALFVRGQEAGRLDAAGLGRLLVTRPGGPPLPLAQVARIERRTGYPAIDHRHGGRALTLTAEIEGNPWAVRRRLDRAIAALHLPPSVATRYTGEYQQLFAVAGQGLWALAAATLLVYGIIALTLGNLLDPLVVLVKLPVDFTGAALALALSRLPLDLTVGIGFVTLLGVSVNNGITLLRFTRDRRARGLEAAAAVREAAALRLRPLLLTHMTTLLALVPAALGLGRGPQLLQPLGVMLFGGLTAGTLFTLTLLPVLYCATERWRRHPAGPAP
ncbi:MAG: efflux RND transporter permease subunit, partial [Nitrospirae bacterium]